MDFEDLIKLEEESPIYSTGNHSEGLKNYMASFYDHDSEIDAKSERPDFGENQKYHIQQIIQHVENYLSIIDTPLEEIVNCMQRLQCMESVDQTLLRKKLIKRKNYLKRCRAKNRDHKMVQIPLPIQNPTSTTTVETEAQIKKKRNRVSAQISRDRKKQYFKELETKNTELQAEILKTRLENQKLKKEIQGNKSKNKNGFFSQTLNNKLTKLLIFLGIICLIGMLRETFASTGQTMSKFKWTQKSDFTNQFPHPQHNKLLDEGHKKVAQFLREPQLQGQFETTSSKNMLPETNVKIIERNKENSQNIQQLISHLQSIKKNMHHREV